MEIDSKIMAMAFGLIAGGFGYWFTTFNMQPILRFRDIRNQVLMNFIFYAQVIQADDLNDAMKELHRERRLANRRTSAQLSASVQDLPKWYLYLLGFKNIDIERAAKLLIGYSNTRDYIEAEKRENAIRISLGFPPEDY